MIFGTEKKELDSKLKSLESPKEILEYLIKNYNLTSPMSSMIKMQFVEGAIKVLNLLNAKKK